jgi:ssDNA-binding replication factor A large subunit
MLMLGLSERMTSDDIIQCILSMYPEMTKAQLLDVLEVEKGKTGGLIDDETLLRVIAARHDVQVPQTRTFNCSLSLSQLIPILKDVTVMGRIVAVSPPKTFEGKQSGKYASLLIADSDCLLRVMLWNDKVDLIESGKLLVGRVVRLSHGYTREDRNGKTELHLGRKSVVEVNPENVNQHDFPFIQRFLMKCCDVTETQPTVRLAGCVKAVSPLSTFTRQDQTIGKVLRFVLDDESGVVTVVAWDAKAEELEPLLTQGAKVCIVNARAKSASNGNGLEVHVDAATFVDFCVFPE